ncbi:MAG: hypothetical protein ACLFRE_00395 [Desulfovermiculus sp.]
MFNKHIIILVLAVLIAGGAVTGWFLFQQSDKLKSLSRNDVDDHEGEIRQQVVSQDVNGSSVNASREVPREVPSDAKDLEHDEVGNQTSAKEKDSWVERSFLTSSLIQDVARVMVDHYSPPGSPGAPGERGRLKISFKILNARYGGEFLSLHSSEDSVKKARNQVLEYMFKPAVLKRIYQNYAPEVVNVLHEETESGQKVVVDPEDKREHASLTQNQAVELFDLYAAYFRDLGRLLDVLTRNPDLIENVKKFLQAKQAAEKADHELNKSIYAIQKQEQNSLDGQEQENKRKLQEEKARSAENFRQALRLREERKQAILHSIQEKSPELGLGTNDIMQVAKWVHRREMAGQNSGSLEIAAHLLFDFADRLQVRARDIQSG